MKKFSLVLFGALVLLAFAGLPAGAQSTMDLAKKEGKVVWYSSLSLSLSQQICNSFNEKNLGIECVLHRSGSGKLYNRYLQEAKAGIYNADVFHTSNIGHFVALEKDNAIMAYRPKGTDSFNKNFLDDSNHWTILRASVYGPIYNTTKVKEADVPKSWKDFLDPKWKGKKLVNAHPSYSGFVSVGMSALVKVLGWEFFDKLAKQQPVIVQSALDTVNYVVRGEALMSVGGTAYASAVAVKKGEPIKHILPEEGLPFIASAQAIPNKAPHPNAAKVFSDWLFSKEVQQTFAENGLYVGHPEVEYPKWQTPLKDVNLIVLSPEEAVKMRKPVRTNFREKFGV